MIAEQAIMNSMVAKQANYNFAIIPVIYLSIFDDVPLKLFAFALLASPGIFTSKV